MRHFLSKLFLVFLLTLPAAHAWAFFPFSVGEEELKTDYSQTVWDRMMQEQSAVDMRRGMTEMATARYKDASDSFAKAVIKNAKDPLPYLLYGASLYWTGKVDSAMSEYREALRLDPKNAMGHQLLAIAYGWKGDIQSAQDEFLIAYNLAPNMADTNMNLGSTYAVQQNWDKALDHFRKAVQLAPREALYHYQLGALYEAMGRDLQAEDSFKKALSLFYNYEDAQLSLGALYEKMGNSSSAAKYFKKAVSTKPGDFVARLRYAVLLVKRGEKQKAREVLDGAFSIIAFKSDGLALNAVYRASGANAKAFENQIQNFKNSLSKIPPSKDIEIEVTLDFHPLTPPAQAKQKNAGRFEEAYQKLRPSGPQAPGDSPMTFKRMFVLNAGDALAREKHIEDLTAELRSAVNQSEGKYDINMSLQGRTLDFNSPAALTQNNQAAPRAAYDPRIVGNDMGLWVTGKTWIKYVEDVYAALQEDASAATDSLPHMLAGLADLVLGDGGGAQQHFRQAAQLAPDEDLPLLGLGTAAVIGGNDEAAKEYYSRVLEQNPKNKTAKRNLEILKE